MMTEQMGKLKSGEPESHHRLAWEVNRTRAAQGEDFHYPPDDSRSIERGETEFGMRTFSHSRAIDHITDQIHEGVRPFRIALKKMTPAL